MASAVKIVAMLTVQTAVFTAIGLTLWIISDRAAPDFLVLSTEQLSLGVVLAAALTTLAAATFYGLPRLSEYLIRAQADNLAFLERPLPFWAIICISLGAGIGEEALFRGGVQTLAGDYVGAPLAIVIASAIFAAIHFAKPLVAVLIFLIGVVFGVVYWQTGSLLAVMVGHALYDVFALWYVQREMQRLGVFDRGAETGSIETE